MPPAKYSSTSYTVIRVPLMHGLPLRTAGFTEIRARQSVTTLYPRPPSPQPAVATPPAPRASREAEGGAARDSRRRDRHPVIRLLDATRAYQREHYHADVLVSLPEPCEYEAPSLADALEEAAIRVLRLTVPDVSVPASMRGCQATVVEGPRAALAAGKTVVQG